MTPEASACPRAFGGPVNTRGERLSTPEASACPRAFGGPVLVPSQGLSSRPLREAEGSLTRRGSPNGVEGWPPLLTNRRLFALASGAPIKAALHTVATEKDSQAEYSAH
jgi:hypothetical protein